MMEHKDIEFERATLNDVEALIEVRNKSFYADFIKYGECPGYHISIESMTKCVLNRFLYKIICDNKIVGNISVKDNQDGTYYLGCLCVIPEYENKGIGRKAMSFVESQFSDATAWTLMTPTDNIRNVYFYKKLGYSIIDEKIDGQVKLYVFEKKMKI